MKQSPLKNKPATIKAPKLVSKMKSPGKALAVKTTITTASNLLPSAALAIDSTASKSSLTKRITLPCTTPAIASTGATATATTATASSSSCTTMDATGSEPVTLLAPVALPPPTPGSSSSSSSSSSPLVPGTPAAAAAPMSRTVWYLGGNQIIKLLTSVDGDLDHAVLANIADVPSVVGDLALSVESLVSDDFTVGGFETDFLAKIAANTLAAKRACVLSPAPAAQPHQEHASSDVNAPGSNDYPHEEGQQQEVLPSDEDQMTMTSDESPLLLPDNNNNS